MDGMIHQPEPVPVMGWGTGYQNETIFNSGVQGYDDYYNMQDNLHRDLFGQEWGKPDSLSDDGLDFGDDDIYGELDLQRVYGQQLAVWTHRSPDTMALFTPIPGDSFMNIVAFARESLEFDTKIDKIMILLPGHSRPVDMDSVFVVSPGTAVLITPRYDYMITLEIKQLGQKLDMVVSLTSTVLEFKGRLQTERGFPVEQLDLLYRDRPLENNRYMFEYRLAHNSTVFVLLTLRNRLLVHVETFWGKEYHLYVDPCDTGMDITARILRRTVSQNVVDVVRLFELFLPRHTLVLYLGARAIDWNKCLGFYGVESGHVFRLSTIGLAHDMALQKVPVILESGRYHHILASKFDRWSAVVLKLHGMTGYPVNLMRLVRHNNNLVDFSDNVGGVSANTMAIRLDLSGIRTDDDLLYGVPLKFKFGHGVTELLKVAPSRTIKSVKETLERVGVPNATSYDLLVEGFRLPSTKRVVDVIDEYKIPIELNLRQYPVFVHGPQNIIYKMLAHGKEALATFLMRVKMKTGLSFKDYTILLCGAVLNEDESRQVLDTEITVRSSIFLVPKKQHRSFFILHEDWLTKLRIPEQADIRQIKDIIWKERNIPEGGLASIGNFLQWYYQVRRRDRHMDKTPLKDKMLVYEDNIGKDFMRMKVETEPHEFRRPKLKNRLDTDLAELEYLLLKQQSLKKKRAVSQPPDPAHGRRHVTTLPGISRHMSAIEGVPVHRRLKASKPKDRHTTNGPNITFTTKALASNSSSGTDNGDVIFRIQHKAGLMPDKTRRQRKGRNFKTR